MLNVECGMMNKIPQYPGILFIIHHFAFLLSSVSNKATNLSHDSRPIGQLDSWMNPTVGKIKTPQSFGAFHSGQLRL
jgi:hypothetical protein